jgi:glutamate 5-kinase
MTREQLTRARRWVVKIGSSLVTADGRGLDLAAIHHWGEQLAALHAAGCEVVLVSSGAVAEGMSRLGWRKRPSAVAELQAAAAVGQMGLVEAYESHFKTHGIGTAQILLTHDDLANRHRYLNARSTLRTLLGLNIIPVVNENDTVTTDEIRFGDNDTLAALVANLIEAEVLVILTDQHGLFDSDPRKNPDAKLVSEASAGDPALHLMASGEGGSLGRGGMATKVTAAERAARSGTNTVICSGREPDVLRRLLAGENIGSLLTAGQVPLLARKRWLANQLKVRGTLHIDAGAARVLRETGASLLAVGVTGVDGRFQRGELVACVGPDGNEVARGLVNYSAVDIRKLKGLPSSQIEAQLGYVLEPELVDRDNMVLAAERL